MKTSFNRLCYSLIVLLSGAACFALWSCSSVGDDEPLPEKMEYLSIMIYSPHPVASRTQGHDPVTATAAEQTIHDVRIWAFVEGKEDPLAFCEVREINQSVVNMQMPIAATTVDGLADGTKVDFYIMANTSGLTTLTGLTEASKRTDLEAATFGHTAAGDDFGSTHAETRGLPEGGLPCSRIVTGQVIKTGGKLTATTIHAELLRAVSRYRMVLARAEGLDDVEVTSLVVKTADGSAGVLKEENLFISAGNEGKINLQGDGEPWTITHPALKGDQIKSRTNLTDLVRGEGEAAGDYEARLDQAIEEGTATEYARTYIRECNVPLTAVVTYRCNQVVKTAQVELKHLTDLASDNLPRNHTWVIYGYFDKGTLSLTANVLPWDKQEGNTSFKNEVSVSQPLTWTLGTESFNSPQNIVFTRNEATADYNVLIGTFTFDTPRPATWYVSLIHQRGTRDAIVFADEDGNPMPGVSVISGPVGKTATIRIVPANSLTTTTNIVSVKFSIEKELNSENMMVDDKIIMGGESGITYTIEQTKNDF